MKKTTAFKRTVFLPKGEPPLAHVSEVKAAVRNCHVSGENGQILLSGALELEIFYLVQEEERMFADAGALLEKLEEAAREPVFQPLIWRSIVVLPWEIGEEGVFTEGTAAAAEVAGISAAAVSPRALETEIILSWEIMAEETKEEPEEIPGEMAEEAPPETAEDVFEDEAAQEGEFRQDEAVTEKPPFIYKQPFLSEAPAVRRVSESMGEKPPAKSAPLPAAPKPKQAAQKNGREQAHDDRFSLRFYRVLPGETLEAISQKTGVEVSAIMALNGLSGKGAVPGAVLTIPKR